MNRSRGFVKPDSPSGPTVLSCFTGVGGLDLGLETAGFVTVGCLETDDFARSALTANRPDWPQLQPPDVVLAGQQLQPGDIGLELGELTLLAGGPPCQPFSKAAQWRSPKKGILDPRGTAVGGMMALVARFLPEAVLMENVPGFLAGEHNAEPTIASAFAAINKMHGTHYELMSWTVDAADYGVAQHRKRAIVLAFREPLSTKLSLPATHRGDHRTAWDALGDDEPETVPRAKGKYADLLASIPEGKNYQHLTAGGAGVDHELFGYRTRFWSFLLKLAKDRPSWTLPASPGPSTGPFHWDSRPLANSERLLLQGFPKEWILSPNERVGTRQAGNATPPPLAEAIGRFVRAVLEDRSSNPTSEQVTAQLATPKREPVAPPPVVTRPLPPRWVAQVRSRDPHPGAGSGPRAHAVTS